MNDDISTLPYVGTTCNLRVTASQDDKSHAMVLRLSHSDLESPHQKINGPQRWNKAGETERDKLIGILQEQFRDKVFGDQVIVAEDRAVRRHADSPLSESNKLTTDSLVVIRCTPDVSPEEHRKKVMAVVGKFVQEHYLKNLGVSLPKSRAGRIPLKDCRQPLMQFSIRTG